jgi:hypothetical protein
MGSALRFWLGDFMSMQSVAVVTGEHEPGDSVAWHAELCDAVDMIRSDLKVP